MSGQPTLPDIASSYFDRPDNVRRWIRDQGMTLVAVRTLLGSGLTWEQILHIHRSGLDVNELATGWRELRRTHPGKQLS